MNLTVVWQPVVDLVTGQVIGAEALGRLADREEDGFQPVADAARAARRTRSTLAKLLDIALLEAGQKPPGQLAFINVTHWLMPRVEEYLEASGNTPAGLVLELPEQDAEIVRWDRLLTTLRMRGVQVALDDWGSGVSDPLRVVSMQPNWIKLDISLTRQVGLNADADRLLSLLVNWTTQAGRSVIAEGIETAEQVTRLRALGVRYGQGFLLARPAHGWPTTVPLPSPQTRWGGLDTTGIMLAQFHPLTDDHLALVAAHHDILHPLIDAVSRDMSQYIAAGAFGTPILLYSSPDRFATVLGQHLRLLFRGELNQDDLVRARRIVDMHFDYGVDLAWYLMAHREMTAMFAAELRRRRQVRLAEAVRSLLTWDAGLVAHTFQQEAERDSFTGLLTRGAFWRRVSAQCRQPVLTAQGGTLILLADFDDAEPDRRHSRGAEDVVTIRVGGALRQAMVSGTLLGWLGGDVVGVWLPTSDRHAAERWVAAQTTIVKSVIPGSAPAVGVATLGTDGGDMAHLYAVADGRLAAARPRPRRRSASR